VTDDRRTLRAVHRGEAEVADHGGLLLRTARDVAEHARGVSMRGVAGAPDWLDYEMVLWHTSEELREYLKARRKIRGSQPLFDAIAELVQDPAFGKGRQNFVMVLGQYGGLDYADVIAGLLDDPDVSAQALHALRKLKDGRFVDAARRLEADPPYPAARREARAYLKALA
jgi:hypothetical protein